MRPEPARRIVTGAAGPLVVWDHSGGSPAALLLHGIGNYGRVWDFVAEAVDGRRRLVAPDARGHGDSAKPAEGYAPSDFAGDALAILDALGLERPLVVGHSMGGGHALAFALAHPERVAGLVIIDIGPELEPEGRARSRRLTAERPASFPDEGAAEQYLRLTSPGYTHAAYANRLRWLFSRDARGLAWRSDPIALRQVFTAADGRRAWDDLATVRCPLLVVRGTRSIYLSEATARRMIATAPGARLLELDAGHNVQLDRPTELAEAIVAFARAVSA